MEFKYSHQYNGDCSKPVLSCKYTNYAQLASAIALKPGMGRREALETIGIRYRPGYYSSVFHVLRINGLIETNGRKYYKGPRFDEYAEYAADKMRDAVDALNVRKIKWARTIA